MRLLPPDEHHLQAALGLAQAAVGLASPNPTVGCVLVRDGAVLGQGAHAFDRRDHAEIVALKAAAAAGQALGGATAYVTLEPCAHHGRTGPCAGALVQAGIARCVAATTDPNPLVRGQGFARLRAAGVEVIVAPPDSALAQQARRLNDAFAFAVQHGRPFVTLKAALSVDGKLAPAPAVRAAGRPRWLTGPAARADVQQLRHAADAIVTGVGTVLADNPSLTDRTRHPRRRPLLRVVLDPSFRTPLPSELVRSAAEDVLIVGLPARTVSGPADLVSAAERDRRREALRAAGAEVLELGGSVSEKGGPGIDLPRLLQELHRRSLPGVFVEAGSRLNGSFLKQGLVDRAVLYYAEAELGRNALPFAAGADSHYTLQAGLTSVERHAFPHGVGEDIRITGYLHDPWTGVT